VFFHAFLRCFKWPAAQHQCSLLQWGCTALSVELEHHAQVLDAYRIGFDVLSQRCAQGLAGTDVKLALVQRAFDLAPLQKAIAHARMAVGAKVIGGEDLTFDFVKRDFFARKLHGNHVAFWNICKCCRVKPWF